MTLKQGDRVLHDPTNRYGTVQKVWTVTIGPPENKPDAHRVLSCDVVEALMDDGTTKKAVSTEFIKGEM